MAEGVTMKATIAQGTPLLIIVDGATSSCPAMSENGLFFTAGGGAGSRVNCIVRNPLVPLVTGNEA